MCIVTFIAVLLFDSVLAGPCVQDSPSMFARSPSRLGSSNQNMKTEMLPALSMVSMSFGKGPRASL